MKKIRINLAQLSENELLKKRKLKSILGGYGPDDVCCGCSCYFHEQGGSPREDNMTANLMLNSITYYGDGWIASGEACVDYSGHPLPSC